ncbi:hypothetical protein [Clostridium scatologenes]|uniref:Uncharacterized protein n=1 Tax=Clostridium scatologenes TaxID=1548 RepID=A0A0E3JNZ3_CLOSL|nr:hypothetical protein [Clostridium scatologenes]AKA69817.1 hypothetical protein CSCA_2692 [Clostridium scatologenes]
MADILIKDCSTGKLIERDYTEKEKQAIEQQNLKNIPTLDDVR